jgi:glycerol 3-phosphatase-2
VWQGPAAGFATAAAVALRLLELLELPQPARAAVRVMATAKRRTTQKQTTPAAIIRLPMPLSPLLARYDHVILDLDGCVWVGDTATRRAPEAIAELRAAGKTLAFVTNDARRSPEEYVRKLWSLGIQASLEEVVTVGSAIQHVLADRGRGAGAYVIGSPAIFRHVADAGQRILNGTDEAAGADVVVVAGHDDLHFRELRVATQAVLAGAEMFAAGRDRTFPGDDGPSPGTGAIVAALEYATAREASIVGKPDPQILYTALDRLGPGRTLMVGDRLDSDLAGADAAGLDAAIVLSGVSSRAEAEAASEPAPVAIAEDLNALIVRT